MFVSTYSIVHFRFFRYSLIFYYDAPPRLSLANARWGWFFFSFVFFFLSLTMFLGYLNILMPSCLLSPTECFTTILLLLYFY